MEWSRYQRDIFDYLETGTGNVMVSALAGSGKTTTICEAARRSPLDTLVCAFNTRITDDLKESLSSTPRIKVQGINSLGMGLLRMEYGGPRDWVRQYKYTRLVAHYAATINRAADALFKEELKALCDAVRTNLVSQVDQEEIAAVANERDIDLRVPDVQISAVNQILTWGMHGIRQREPGQDIEDDERWMYGVKECIDFTDQLWIPNLQGLGGKQYARVFVDEAQDLSIAQQEMVLRFLLRGGRICVVGDPRQAIYGFAGADYAAWARLEGKLKPRLFTLPICYRCPRKVVALAQRIVPDMVARDDAPEGVVEGISEEGFVRLVQPGDLVLCRTNAPLVHYAFLLLRLGRRATVLGREIGNQLTTLAEMMLKANVTFARFETWLNEWLGREITRLAEHKDAEKRIANLKDRVETLIVIKRGVEEAKGKTVMQLVQWIKQHFEDESRKIADNFVVLSTIHKIKGQERDRVFILKPNLIPHPMVQTSQAMLQEYNLRYVAETRSRAELYFVGDWDGWLDSGPRSHTEPEEEEDLSGCSSCHRSDRLFKLHFEDRVELRCECGTLVQSDRTEPDDPFDWLDDDPFEEGEE